MARVFRGEVRNPALQDIIFIANGDAFVGGRAFGCHASVKSQAEIDYGYDEFKKIIGSKKFKSVYGQLYEEEN